MENNTFGEEEAKANLKDYRKRGPANQTKLILEAIRSLGLRDVALLDIGGGIGTIGIASAIQTGSNIRFNFTAPVCGGGAPGRGYSSFFWGLVSRNKAKFVNATLHETGGATHVVKARSPQ